MGRWSLENPGNQAIHEQRARLLAAAIRRAGLDEWPASGLTLDVGCGAGTGHHDLASRGLDVAGGIGVDRSLGRLNLAHDVGLSLVAADAGALPFQTCAFVAVRAFTIFSSVPHAQRGSVAHEVSRVLMPGGLILWYDMRITHPLNRETSRVSRDALHELFAGYAIDVEPATVVPQVARRLGPATERAYRWLSRLPGMSTHLVGALRKPG